ncbi:gamma carbonic anhydrase family protein [Pectinatus haikarae]|uniref:Carbonic anhydrase/acetyltransferase-like protein (Isoleucine patch superfamily) n=1 Tax=Pectinatus haikarae TaxID=349096 RepID=A0ABT9Y6C2_9FIRM|nr:gamma carbonic anhydrase family protein [Pectinatus haikarae]MDQ0202752.1 carbonic anhydrase/acetyltransferase-like protein (isoleucine patch superfamily) [Pectinatus haikarae]
MPIIPYKGKRPQIGKNVFIAPTAVIIGDVTIGDNSSIWYNAVLRGDMNSIIIGSYTNIQDNTTIHVMECKPTIVGSYVTVGHNVVMHCDKIGDNCLVGMGSILLGMCTVGDNSIIGAGTLVPHKTRLPSNSMILGSPYKVKRELHDDEIEAIHQSALNYHLLAENYTAEKQE